MNLREYASLPQKELIKRIQKGKAEKDILIIAHNYCRPEVQQIADFQGDSLALSRIARDAKEPIILFAGVLFMAETAKILSPEKTILVPDSQATCPLASDAAYEDVLLMKEKYPNAVFVAYVNSSAEVKSLVDICCTSSNAVDVINSIPKEKDIVFLPDRNLGAYTMKKTGRKNIILWDGGCYVHRMIDTKWAIAARKKYPNATIISHPEAPPEVAELSDHVGSTSYMYNYALEHPNDTIILGTEVGLVDRIKNENPEINILPLKPSASCSNMKLNTLPKIARSIDKMIYEIKLSKEILSEARNAIEKMASIGR